MMYIDWIMSKGRLLYYIICVESSRFISRELVSLLKLQYAVNKIRSHTIMSALPME